MALSKRKGIQRCPQDYFTYRRLGVTKLGRGQQGPFGHLATSKREATIVASAVIGYNQPCIVDWLLAGGLQHGPLVLS